MASAASPGIPTPPASSAAASQHASLLPQPRRQPLKPGGPKESELIRYLDHGVNSIQKRVDNRTTNRKTKPAQGDEDGYGAFADVAKDVEALVDVVWVSASRMSRPARARSQAMLTVLSLANLQTPYLLNLAVLTAEFLPMFPTTARSLHATFRLLSKLDEAFSSLLVGHDAATGETLPGFDGGRHVSTTDKVRLKGIVDRTRLTVTRVMTAEDVTEDGSTVGDSMDTDTEGEAPQRQDTVKFEGFEDDDDDDEQDIAKRDVAGVYEKTIGELGDVLGGPPIGIITDDWAANGTD